MLLSDLAGHPPLQFPLDFIWQTDANRLFALNKNLTESWVVGLVGYSLDYISSDESATD